MHEHTKPYVGIVSAIEELGRSRNDVVTNAFAVLELHHPALAELVLQSTRCRSEAALWMFRPHRALGGKTGYQALVDDNEDALWDELTLTLQRA